MNADSKNKLATFLEQRLIFILTLITIVFLEIAVYNQEFFITALQELQEHHFEVKDGTLFGFQSINGLLISEHNDPNITINQIDDRVRFINIQCTNTNPDSLSQVFFRSENEDWTEENSITLTLSDTETLISLSRTIELTSLRLDLTNTKGDRIHCQGFTLNPKTPFNPGYLRLVLLLISFIVLLLSEKTISNATTKLSQIPWIRSGIWIFIALIIFIDFQYPVTITFDSAHYLWLADLIKTGTWVIWDPIRYIGFPLHLFLNQSILGYNQVALLLPMVLGHSLLFLFCCLFIFDIFNLHEAKDRFIISLIVFLLIAMDTTVFGYFHTLLTEYLAATIAIISCYVAIKLYESPLFSKRFYLLSCFYLLMVPIAWHIKQPFIGASLFPLIIVSLLILIQHKTLKSFAYILGLLLAIMIIVLLSTLAWNNFLRSQGNPLPQERQLSTFLQNKLTARTGSSEPGAVSFMRDRVDEFFAISNYYYFDYRTRSVIKEPMIGRSNENDYIAHRMFTNPWESNLMFSLSELMPYASYYKTTYDPPSFINNLFQSRIKFSNLLFTLTNLFIPIICLFSVVMWIKNKNTLYASLLILSSASFMNMIAQAVLIIPLDRYQFWGYILNLLILIIATKHLVPRLIRKIKKPKINCIDGNI